MNPQAQNLIIVLSGVLLVISIGCTPAEKTDAPPPPAQDTPLPAPPELQAARLLYQRPDGIYLANPATGNGRLIIPGGRYPRWFRDGRRFAFLRGQQILLADIDTLPTERLLATAKEPAGVAVRPDGRAVLFIEGDTIRQVALDTGTDTTLLSGFAFRELAAGTNAIVATVKVPLRGFRMMRFDLPDGSATTLGSGCSASLSPDGTTATLNLEGHRQLALVNLQTHDTRQHLPAPAPHQLDNQYWSNHTNWIAAVCHNGNVMLQRISDHATWRTTTTRDADRPDLFVP